MYWNVTDKEGMLMAIAFADNPALLEKFLNEIFTGKELEACVARLKAMCLLHDEAPYTAITTLTGLSSATIARLAKKVNEKNSAFRQILKKFKRQGPAYFE